jgi:hypothetical protein
MSGVVEQTECWGTGDKIFDILHSCYLLCSEIESNVFVHQVNKGTGMLSKIFDEYPYEPADAKEAVDASDVYRYWPVLNLLRFGFMGDMAFIVASLS